MVAGLVWVVALGVFLTIQWRLSVGGNTYIQDTAHTTWLDRSAVRLDLELAAIRFLGASLAMAALVIGVGRRLSFAVPVLMALVLPALFGGVPDCYAFDQSRAPHGLGPGWNYTAPISGCGYQLFATWGGALLDLGLVIAPFVVLAAGFRGRSRPAARYAHRPASSLLALVISFVAVIVIMSVRERLGYPTDWYVWLAIHIPLLTFGLMLGLRRSWWGLTLLIVPLALFPLQAGLPYTFEPWNAAYLVGVTLAAASWRPVAHVLEEGRSALARSSRRIDAVPAGS